MLVGGLEDGSRCPALIQLYGISLAGLKRRWDFMYKFLPGRHNSPVCEDLYEVLWGGNYDQGGSMLFKRIPYIDSRGTGTMTLYLKDSACHQAP